VIFCDKNFSSYTYPLISCLCRVDLASVLKQYAPA
jgi:hypothetical protein